MGGSFKEGTDDLRMEIYRLRGEVAALLTLLPTPSRVMVKPVVERLVDVLARIAEKL